VCGGALLPVAGRDFLDNPDALDWLIQFATARNPTKAR
jgi:hypothetical protein